MRTYGTMSRAGFVAVFALVNVLASHEADAGWPPPPEATPMDVANPAYWPNDPDYGFSEQTDGQWTHYGFLPAAASGVERRPSETTTGMSVDLAWRVSIGDPRVIIAVTGGGVLWDEPDLLDKVFINQGELSAHKPLHADQSACGGSGNLAGFDCNGDGSFTISDYAESLNVAADDHNANGVIDAGDLILAFSDGIDDDSNGYVDDISGWDFFKDDNDAFDDPRDGHATRDAAVAAAATNNGIAGAGVCPLCRVLPLRVGDGVIADAQDFAQALVYAADNGANVVQSALETTNMTRFAEAAIAYAYAKDVLVVTATSHVGSRRHDLPATTNYTLAAHALGFDGPSVALSHSFIAANPCAQFGSHNFLSVSSARCDTGVAGALAGVAGLMVSTALAQGPTANLTAGEMQALLIGTVDDVDVPESRMPGSGYLFSQPGFDERFGYGRINATRALEAIVTQHIPPTVTITSPRWFDVLDTDKLDAPVEIRGSIAARRANAYDYVVDWAAGAEPHARDFDGHVVAQQENIDPTTVVGDADALALLDVRHVSALIDNDQQTGPMQPHHSITVRVRATGHYGGDVGDVSSETRRTYYLHSDPDLLPGFPLPLGDSIESSPKMADIDGNGIRDLVVLSSGGSVFVFTLTDVGPVALPGFPFQTNFVDGLGVQSSLDVPNYRGADGYASSDVSLDGAREGFVNAPAIADLDGDGTMEIVASSFAGTIYVVEPDGSSRPGFPRSLPRVPSCPAGVVEPPPGLPCTNATNRIARGAFAAPVLVDLDDDGKLDIVQAALDGQVYAIDADGVDLLGFPLAVRVVQEGQTPVASRLVSTPAVGDVDGDGIMNIALGSSMGLGDNGDFGALFVVDGRGLAAPQVPVLAGWPVTFFSPNSTAFYAEGLTSSPAIGNFDSKMAIVAQGNGSTPLVLPSPPGAQLTDAALPGFALPEHESSRGLDAPDRFGALSRVPQPNTMVALLSSPALGDVDQDGTPDVVTAGGSTNLVQRLRGDSLGAQSNHLLAVWSGATGKMLPGSPFPLEEFSTLQDRAIADLNGDDYPEIIGGSGGPYLHAYDGCGVEPEGFPKFTGQWIAGTPAVGDLDGDGRLEVAVGTRSGTLYVWHTKGATNGVIAWESFHHDNRNTGNLGVALDQGVLHKALAPLTELSCRQTMTLPRFEGVGGCGCRTAGDRDETVPLGVLMAGICSGFVRRRVRRRASR